MIIIAAFLAGCGNQDQQKIQELQSQIDRTQSQFKNAQSELETNKSQLAEAKSTIEALKAHVTDLETKLQHQNTGMEEQEKLIRTQRLQVDELTEKLKKLYAPTSSAIQLLEDFSLRFTAVNTKEGADKMCIPLSTGLSKLASSFPANCRTAILINSAIQATDHYRVMIDNYSFLAGASRLMSTEQTLIAGSRGGTDDSDERAINGFNGQADKGEAKMRSEGNEFKEKIKECIALLKEQRGLMQ